MVEYIEKEEAQKIICGWCGVCKSPTVCDLMHCDDICPQFAQIPAADVRPRWIPVEEELPEEKRDGFSDDVLMLVVSPDGDCVWRDVYVGYYLYDANSDETGWWTMMTCGCAKVGEHKHGGSVFKANERVTHWMPLPEPPEEGET